MFTLNCGDSSWPSPSFLYPGCTGGSSPWTLLKLGPQMYKKKLLLKWIPHQCSQVHVFCGWVGCNPIHRAPRASCKNEARSTAVDGRWSMIDPWWFTVSKCWETAFNWASPTSALDSGSNSRLDRMQCLGRKVLKEVFYVFFQVFCVFFRILGIKRTRSFLQEDSKAKAWSSNKRCHT